jgi:hypothetical protein
VPLSVVVPLWRLPFPAVVALRPKARASMGYISRYAPGRFSFNVKGGRCENCAGDGTIRIGMDFLPDVYVPCEVCHGTRYNREMLEVRYKGRTIAEVLDMTIEKAAEFFAIAVPPAASSPAWPHPRPLLPAWPPPLRSAADFPAGHQAGEEQRRGPAHRDHVQADDRAEAFDLTGDADHGRQDVDRGQPVNDRQPEEPTVRHCRGDHRSSPSVTRRISLASRKQHG